MEVSVEKIVRDLRKLELCRIKLNLVDSTARVVEMKRVHPETEKIVIPDGIREIRLAKGFRSRGQVENVEKVVLPESLKVIGRSVFRQYRSLKSIDIPKGSEVIEGTAFEHGLYTYELDLSDTSIKKFGSSCFWGCKIKRVKLPKTVKSIGKYAFSLSMEDFDLSETNKRSFNIKEIALADNTIEIVRLPGSMREMNLDCMERFKRLKAITIPGGRLKGIKFKFSNSNKEWMFYVYVVKNGLE